MTGSNQQHIGYWYISVCNMSTYIENVLTGNATKHQLVIFKHDATGQHYWLHNSPQ
jgi:hypothetical protein